jgi:hypothetical protein
MPKETPLNIAALWAMRMNRGEVVKAMRMVT